MSRSSIFRQNIRLKPPSARFSATAGDIFSNRGGPDSSCSCFGGRDPSIQMLSSPPAPGPCMYQTIGLPTFHKLPAGRPGAGVPANLVDVVHPTPDSTKPRTTHNHIMQKCRSLDIAFSLLILLFSFPCSIKIRIGYKIGCRYSVRCYSFPLDGVNGGACVLNGGGDFTPPIQTPDALMFLWEVRRLDQAWAAYIICPS